MQEIPVFGRRAMNIEPARAGERAAEARLVQVKAELASNVVQAFSEYLYILETQALQKELIQLLEQRSEERRVGKESRCQLWCESYKEKRKKGMVDKHRFSQRY